MTLKGKTCSNCSTFKTFENFYRKPGKNVRYRSQCMHCEKAYADQNRERINERARGYYKRNGGRKPVSAAYCQDWLLKHRYGITAKQREEMCVAQKGLCAICKTTPRRLVVDHCHTTKKVRGLLCDECNRGIGALKEDPLIFAAALAYLDKT